jgi:hypothetical protein
LKRVFRMAYNKEKQGDGTEDTASALPTCSTSARKGAREKNETGGTGKGKAREGDSCLAVDRGVVDDAVSPQRLNGARWRRRVRQTTG